MKRPQRDTTVFSLSALDLFCSAMGVFMILTFIALPFYGKKSPSPQPTETTPTTPNTVVISCLFIQIEWKKNSDIDLHVVDPEGRHFYYGKKEHRASSALLTTDSLYSGAEIWIDHKAAPGRYEVYCNLFPHETSRNVPTEVKMRLITAGGREDLPPFTLSTPKGGKNKGTHIATLVVHEDGSINKTLHYTD